MPELGMRPEFANWTDHLIIKVIQTLWTVLLKNKKEGLYGGNQRQGFKNYERHENMSCHYLVVLRLFNQMVLIFNYIFLKYFLVIVSHWHEAEGKNSGLLF